jgi:hypothetical protein
LGLFSRKSAAPPPPPPPNASRDIPPLYPAFYKRVLLEVGKPVTPENLIALANLTTANLALNAHRWMEAIGTPAERARWSQRFHADDPDLERLARRPDAMVDFLWEWNPRVHPGLREFVGNMERTLQDSAIKYGDQLPFDMWGAS